jgi:general secretion pathway protein F
MLAARGLSRWRPSPNRGRGARQGSQAEGRRASRRRIPASAARPLPERPSASPFLESLHDLTTSGLSAGEAVRLLSMRIKEPRLRTLCERPVGADQRGRAAVAGHGGLSRRSSTATVNLIRAGEATGSLNDTLARLIAHLTEQRELRRQLLTALAYPAS